jgi:hypothetical protein
MHSECRHKQRPEHHDQLPFELNVGTGNRTATGPRPPHKSWARFLIGLADFCYPINFC